MSSTNYRVRRATVDDLGVLRPIWESMKLPAPVLEKRLTEFQVTEDAAGKVAGGVGFQISGRHACIHSEGFTDQALAESLRPLLWERIQTMITNHGIARLWTQEQSPFWKQQGLAPADAEALKRLPEAWAAPGASWLTHRLKDEDVIVSLEKELAMFMESEKQSTEKMFRQARTLKIVATVLAIVFALFVMAAMFYMFRKNPEILERFKK